MQMFHTFFLGSSATMLCAFLLSHYTFIDDYTQLYFFISTMLDTYM